MWPENKAGRGLWRKAGLWAGCLAILWGVPSELPAIDPWVSHGPPGGKILSLAIDPQTPAILYAGTFGGGVFKSTNEGRSWTLASRGMTEPFVEALAIDPYAPATLYAGTDGGVFRSNDRAGNWTPLYLGSGQVRVLALAIDPQMPGTLYAGTDGAGVYKSSDAGASWTAMNSGLTNPSVSSLAIDPLLPATLYAGTSGGVYRSTTGGTSWTLVNAGLANTTVSALAIDRQTPATIYAGTSGGGVFRSTNHGGLWNAINSRLTNAFVNAIVIDPTLSSSLYIGTDGGLFKSTNQGDSWTLINSGLTSVNVSVVVINPQTPAMLYAGTMGNGVFRSRNGGTSWASMSSGLTNSAVYALAVDPQMSSTLFAGTDQGIFRSFDGGGTWSAAPPQLSGTAVHAFAIDPQTPSTLYAGANGSVFKSTDAGHSWSGTNGWFQSTNVLALAIDPETPTTLYAGTWRGGVFKSINGGGSWSEVNIGLKSTTVYALVIDPQVPSTIYAGTLGGGVFKSVDGAATWFAANLGLASKDYVLALAIDPRRPATLFAGTDGGVYKSTNGAGSWTAVNSGMTDVDRVNALVIDRRAPSVLYAGTLGGGVYRSTNWGLSWSTMNLDEPRVTVCSLAIDPERPLRVYAGTEGGGVFVYAEIDCSYQLSSTSKAYSNTGVKGDQIMVTALGGCGWSAVSNDYWITITGGVTGSGSGAVTFSVAPNLGSASRFGSMTIAGQTITITQAGVTPTFFISGVSPVSGPLTGKTPIEIDGSGFQVGLSVAIGGVKASVNNVTSQQILATTGAATAPGTYDVVVKNPGGQSVVLSKSFTYLPVVSQETQEIFAPIVLSSTGRNGSFFTSELALTNRGQGNATIKFTYVAAIGSGSGTATDTLGPGQQKIVHDAIGYLRSLGIPIPSSGSQGGSLRLNFSGLASSSDAGATIRTTTPVPEGRAGMTYPGIVVRNGLTESSYLCGLRQDQRDRSNVAIQNLGSAADGYIVMKLTVFSGAGNDFTPHVLPYQVLAPGGWMQVAGILDANGLSINNGFVEVERISGTSPYFTYGVINDQANSDGSFIVPVPESAMENTTRLVLPAVVETKAFSTELVVTNWSTDKKTLTCRYVADALVASNKTVSFTLEVNPGQQMILPDMVDQLRQSQR
ncbi:MAG: IPT/TIG domain-containing protein, partial [Terriglobia bacterium]